MKRISIRNLPEQATMAHVMVAVGIFPSVSQARKNGWDKPISLGVHTLTKRKIPVEIVDEDIAPLEKTVRPDLEPGFWNEYVPPASNVAAAIQFPIYGENWKERVMTAYYKDIVAARKAQTIAKEYKL